MPLDSDIRNADDNLFVEFYESSKNPEVSKPFLRIVIPGDQTQTWDQPVREADKTRFMRQWLAFLSKNGKDQFIGVPLGVWHKERPEDITDGQLMELQIKKFQTVEQVAQMSDKQAQGIGMGGDALRIKALAFIAARNGNLANTAMNKTNDEVAALKAQLEEIKAMLQAQPLAAAQTPKRRGPKPGFKKKVQLNVQHSPATGSAGGQ